MLMVGRKREGFQCKNLQKCKKKIGLFYVRDRYGYDRMVVGYITIPTHSVSITTEVGISNHAHPRYMYILDTTLSDKVCQ